MEFKSLKNIESSFRQIRLFGIVFLSLCAVITVWSVWSSYRFAERPLQGVSPVLRQETQPGVSDVPG